MNAQVLPIVSDENAHLTLREFLSDPSETLKRAISTVRLVDEEFYLRVCVPLRQVQGARQSGVGDLLARTAPKYDSRQARAIHAQGAAAGALYVYAAIVREWMWQQERSPGLSVLPSYAGFLEEARSRISEDLVDHGLLAQRNPALWYPAGTLADCYGTPVIRTAAQYAYGLLSLYPYARPSDSIPSHEQVQ